MIQVFEYLQTKTIFDSTSLSAYDFLDTNIIDALNKIFGVKYNKMYMVDDNETTIHGIVDDTILLNVAKYNDIYNAMQLDPTIEYSETKTNSGTVTNELTPSIITTVADSKNTADNATLRVTDQTQTSSTGSDVNERTDDLTEERYGYNNVFDNVNKLMSFVNMELYDTLINDIMKAICYPIYSIDDLAF